MRKDTDEKFDMAAAVERMQKYWNTYDRQHGYENWDKEMFLNDALYGVGHSMYKHKYRHANGYQKFKDFLGARFFKERLKRKVRTKVASNEK